MIFVRFFLMSSLLECFMAIFLLKMGQNVILKKMRLQNYLSPIVWAHEKPRLTTTRKRNMIYKK